MGQLSRKHANARGVDSGPIIIDSDISINKKENKQFKISYFLPLLSILSAIHPPLSTWVSDTINTTYVPISY
jgi:hypothetical protein